MIILPDNGFRTKPGFRKDSQRLHSGFTLVELLVVIGILAIILTITLIAINPLRQFRAAGDTRRKAELSETHKSLLQFFVQNKFYPNEIDWNTLECGGPVPSPFSPFMGTIPCDPETEEKYVYQALDSDCQPCNTQLGRCSAYRLFTSLQNNDDPSITNIGCNQDDGCGLSGPDGKILNYGVSSGCSIFTTPVPISPTPATSLTPTITPGGPTLTPTVFVSPTNTPTPFPTATAGPTPTIPVTPQPAFTPDTSFDLQRASRLQEITLALEKYRFLYGQYPVCGTYWQEASACLDDHIAPLLPQLTVPVDPESGANPFIYITYSTGLYGGIYDGFCLGAHMGDETVWGALSDCPVGAPLSIYQYRIKEREEIIYRPNENSLTETEKDARDNQRISDINYFVNIMEQHKSDYGYYPTCWNAANTWASTGSGNFFCRGNLAAYGTNFNFDPGGEYSYNIVQWDPDQNGRFRQYCFGSYMDKGNNLNCDLSCPVNNYNSYYCYFIKNP